MHPTMHIWHGRRCECMDGALNHIVPISAHIEGTYSIMVLIIIGLHGQNLNICGNFQKYNSHYLEHLTDLCTSENLSYEQPPINTFKINAKPGRRIGLLPIHWPDCKAAKLPDTVVWFIVYIYNSLHKNVFFFKWWGVNM